MELSKQDQATLAIAERQRINQVRQKIENRAVAKVYALIAVSIGVTVAVAMWLGELRLRGVI